MFKLYVNYVCFTTLSLLVFHPLFLDYGSVYQCDTCEEPQTFSNTLMYVY